MVKKTNKDNSKTIAAINDHLRLTLDEQYQYKNVPGLFSVTVDIEKFLEKLPAALVISKRHSPARRVSSHQLFNTFQNQTAVRCTWPGKRCEMPKNLKQLEINGQPGQH